MLFNFFQRNKIRYNDNKNNIFNKTDILKILQKEFRLDLYGIHGIDHWERVFTNS